MTDFEWRTRSVLPEALGFVATPEFDQRCGGRVARAYRRPDGVIHLFPPGASPVMFVRERSADATEGAGYATQGGLYATGARLYALIPSFNFPIDKAAKVAAIAAAVVLAVCLFVALS